MVTFGEAGHCDVRVLDASMKTLWDEHGFRQHFRLLIRGEEIEVEVPLAGRHNCMNAAAAIAVALESGVPAQTAVSGLGGIRPVKGRLYPQVTASGLRIIDDSYNANPDSVAAAISVLTAVGGNSVLVLGDLAELGDDPRGAHRQLGRAARELGVGRLYTLGPLSEAAAGEFGKGAMACMDIDTLVAALKQELGSEDVILVKGSRTARMERVVEALVSEDEEKAC